ncbi:mucin-binding protein, partial [Lactobacillus amylovorus]|uniref:mucin-binding protein n=1 Tax=Lactobacillus amylovorus TaxID=1604 RepID=UPI003F9594B8
MRNRIVTAVKQRFSIRKLSIGAASVLLGTSLYFMGGSATIVHAANGSGDASQNVQQVKPAGDGQQQTPTNDNYKKLDSIGKKLDSIARNKNNDDTTVNNAIDKYAQGKQEEVGDNALIRASGKEPTTPANTADERGDQVDSIAVKLDQDVKNANQEAQKINDYKNAHPNTVSGEGAQHFADQGLSIDDEPDSEINQITVDHNNQDKGNTLSKGQSETIDGIHITHTTNMTHKEQYVMKINSNNKVIVDFQHNQCSGKEITVTYDDLKNSYYLENINNKTNKIKISKIERTFSDILEADKIRFTSDGQTPKGADGAYDECYGPQLIIYNDPSDGFFYNNITQVSVNDIYYDDKGSQINFDTKNDNNKAWIFVTSLNSNGWGNIEKVSAQGPNNSSVDVEKIAGSTVTNHNGLWYSDNNNNFGGNPDWDNRDEANRFGFVGTVAVQYHPGMTLQYSVEDWQWGSHWACTQTQVVSSLDTPVIIYDHIKDGAVPVTPKTPSTDIPKNTVKEAQPNQLTKEVHLTVNYENSDGTKFTVEPPANQNQTVTFTGTAYVDKITGELVNAKQVDGTWVVDDSKTDKPQVIWTVKDGKEDKGSFTGVTSPSEAGYYVDRVDVKVGDQQLDKDTDEYSAYTDGKDVKAVENITHNHENIVITVIYAPYQKAGLTIIDEDDIRAAEPNGHKLDSYSDTGKSGNDIAFTGAKDAVDAYLKAGYIWDSAKNKATDGTKADNYDGLKIGKLDKDASKDQNWTIYLKHGTTTFDPDKPNQPEPGAKLNPDDPNQDGPKVTKDMVDDKKQVTSTINYIVSDSKSNPAAPAAPKKNVQTATWKRTITVDNVTGHIISSTDWKTSDHYTKVDTPDLGGYYADKSSVPAPQVTQENVTTDVTYYPYQKAGLTIIDEDDIRAAEPNGHKLDSYSDTGKSGND